MRRSFLALALCGFFLACGCSFGPGKDDILAVADGRVLSRQEFLLKAKLYGIDIKTEKEAEQFLNLLINDSIVLELAKKSGVSFTSEELKEQIENFAPDYSSKETKKALKAAGIKYGYWLKDIKEKILRKKIINLQMQDKIKVQDGEVKDYFWSNILDFRRMRKVRVRQIVTDTEEKAKEVQQLIMRGEPFEKLAEKYSVTSEGKTGGDLGYFGDKEMPAFITDVVFHMKKGQVSGIEKSPYGWHIFKVEDIQEPSTPKFEEVKKDVYNRYFEEKKDEYFSAWMEELRKAVKIEINSRNLERVFVKEEN